MCRSDVSLHNSSGEYGLKLSSSSATKSVNLLPTSTPTRVRWLTPQHELRERREMLWFVEAELVATGEFEHRHQTPAAVSGRCRFDSLFLELLYCRGDVVADQPRFVFGVVFRLMAVMAVTSRSKWPKSPSRAICLATSCGSSPRCARRRFRLRQHDRPARAARRKSTGDLPPFGPADTISLFGPRRPCHEAPNRRPRLAQRLAKRPESSGSSSKRMVIWGIQV